MKGYAYSPNEVTLFCEQKDGLVWVVEYHGGGHYFDTFEEAIAYIRQRHDSDPDTFAVARKEEPWRYLF